MVLSATESKMDVDEEPAKIALKRAKKQKIQELVDENNQNEPSKKVRLFSAKQFRQQLNSNEKLIALKSFLQCLNNETKHDYIGDYLDSGGNCLELLQILEMDSTISPVLIFDLVTRILLKIQANYPQYYNSAHESSRYLLNNYLPVINKMINLSSSGQERVVVMKLLTTIVTLSTAIAKDVLIQVNFNQTNLELLTKQTGEDDSVRNVFIHFLTAFLVDGQYPTLSVLLEKRGLLTSIINGLQYDVADTVCIVLTAMKNHILENPLVSKTVKMKTFSTPVVREIVNLYNWKGPEGFKANKKNNKEVITVNEYEKSKVSESVHQFLLVLCTSYSLGVIFRDPLVGLGKKNQNSLMYTVLESLERPWEHSYASELVIKICGACPDLTKTMWANLKTFLELRLTKRWLNAMSFAKKLLCELKPKCIEFCVKDLTVYQLTQIISFLVAPTPIVKTLIPENNSYERHTIKQNVLKILLKMLQSVSGYLVATESWLKPNDHKKLKKFLSDHISRNFPNAQTILYDWDTVDIDTEENSHLNVNEYLNVILDVFIEYKKLSPHLLESLNSSDIDIQLFLRKIEETCDDFHELQVKAVNIFLDLDMSKFLPETEVFGIVFPLLLKFYHENFDENSLKVLNKLLKNTSIFEGCEYEINVWLNGILDLKKFDKDLGDVLVEVIRTTNVNVLNYLEVLSEIQSSNELEGNFAEVIENLANENFSITTKNCIKHKYLSPLVVGFLQFLHEHEQSKNLKIYSQFVLVNLLHSLTSTTVFKDLLKKFDAAPKNVIEYCNSWAENLESVALVKSKGVISIFKNFSEAFLSNDLSTFLKINQENFNLYPGLTLNLLQANVFYLNNLVISKKINDNHIDNSLIFVKHLLNNGVVFSQEYLQTILGSPTLFENFSLQNLSKNKAESFSTKFIVNIVKEFLVNDLNIEMYLRVYREKLVKIICKILKKPEKYDDFCSFIEIVKVFSLDYEHCVEILTKIQALLKNIDPLKVQFFSEVIVYCLDQISILYHCNPNLKPLNEDLVENLIRYFTILIENQEIISPNISSALKNYLSVYPHNILQLDKNFFESLLKLNEYNKNNTELLIFLLERQNKFLESFKRCLDSFCDKKGVLLPLLQVVMEKTVKEAFLEQIYQKFEASIVKALQKPQKAGQHFQQNFRGVQVLIEKFMPVEKCRGYIEKVQKFETSEVFHAALLKTITKKVFNDKINGKLVNNVILIFIHLQMTLFKRMAKSYEDSSKLAEIASIFNEILEDLLVKSLDFDLKSVTNNETFKTYCKFCLKFGISGESVLLTILKNLLMILSNNLTKDDGQLLLDMLISHSAFLDVVLGEHSQCKQEILELFLTICKNWQEVMDRSHVPVLLAAYRATVSRCDRIILRLLDMYEQNSDRTKLHEFQPYLWGRAAASYYSVRTNIENALRRQPKMADVLNILQADLVESTIVSYPLHSGLATTNDDIGKIDSDAKSYDLRFILPLFGQLLAPEQQVQTYRFCRSGSLSLTIVALSSFNKEVRQAACYVLSRFYYHLEAKQGGKDKILWLRFIEAVTRGIRLLPDFKLNNFAAVFLARTANILTDPTHVMYVPLASYLTAKLSLDFNTVPELYTFLHSNDINYKEHRIFILEVLKDGVRTEKDFTDLLRSMAFKLFSQLFSSSLSDRDTKLLILDVIDSICKIPLGVKMICENHSFLAQIYSTICDLVGSSEKNKDVHFFIVKCVNILYKIARVVIEGFSCNLILCMLKLIVEQSFYDRLNDDTLRIFYDTLYSVFCRSNNCFDKNFEEKIVCITNDRFCKYVVEYGCDFITEKSLGDKTDIYYYLRLLFYKKYKR